MPVQAKGALIIFSIIMGGAWLLLFVVSYLERRKVKRMRSMDM
jgi:hypothetical protein